MGEQDSGRSRIAVAQAAQKRRPWREQGRDWNMIDARAAARLRNEGLGWKKIGVLLAEKAHRKIAFKSESVKAAVRRHLAKFE